MCERERAMNILSVAEKPSVAKELARIISKGQHSSRQGHSIYNRIFDIEHCMFKDSPAKMKMTSVSGHMMELEFDPQYKTWSSCPPIALFTAPLHKTVKKEVFNIYFILYTIYYIP